MNEYKNNPIALLDIDGTVAFTNISDNEVSLLIGTKDNEPEVYILRTCSSYLRDIFCSQLTGEDVLGEEILEQIVIYLQRNLQSVPYKIKIPLYFKNEELTKVLKSFGIEVNDNKIVLAEIDKVLNEVKQMTSVEWQARFAGLDDYLNFYIFLINIFYIAEHLEATDLVIV